MANDMAKTPVEKKPKAKKRGLGAWFKDIWSELKKVSWPKLPKVVKQTGVVIAVVLVFLVALTLMDIGLGRLYELLTTGLQS